MHPDSAYAQKIAPGATSEVAPSGGRRDHDPARERERCRSRRRCRSPRGAGPEAEADISPRGSGGTVATRCRRDRAVVATAVRIPNGGGSRRRTLFAERDGSGRRKGRQRPRSAEGPATAPRQRQVDTHSPKRAPCGRNPKAEGVVRCSRRAPQGAAASAGRRCVAKGTVDAHRLKARPFSRPKSLRALSLLAPGASGVSSRDT